MESEDGEVAEKEYADLTVDLSKQTLKRIERADSKQQLAETLILDQNEIQKLDNLETYVNLKKLSLTGNQLIRMYGVSSLTHLTTLDISNNALVVIEGLNHLTELQDLNLAKNKIKNIERLRSNSKLEKLDLSQNIIMCFSDLSFLQNLRELKLGNNRINHLTLCEKYLPHSLEVFTVNNNLIPDLNEVSYLGHLTSLREFSIANNPCVDFPEDQKFNYRPFVKNWISNLVNLDDSPLDDIECLKAEWLYSQGRGRSFRPGEHAALVEYLNSVCPKEGNENAKEEDVKKLKLILSKAQLHQQQLREQLSSGKVSEASKPVLLRKKISDRMVTSFQESPSKDLKSSQVQEIMTRSLDSGVMRKSSKSSKADATHTPLQTSTVFIPIPDSLISPDVGHPMITSSPGHTSLHTSTAGSRTSRSSSINSLRSTPEAKRKTSTSLYQRRSECSPVTVKKTAKANNSRSSTPVEHSGSPGKSTPSRRATTSAKKGHRSRDSDRNFKETSEEEDSEAPATKSRAVHQKKATQARRVQNSKENPEQIKSSKENKVPNDQNIEDTKAWKASVCIQRRWRGYKARNLNGDVLSGCKDIQMNRIQDYIRKVMNDLDATRVALEGNRKLVVLQMQAINSLWKKISALQPGVGPSPTENQACLQNLAEICSTLSTKVEGLQEMMKNMQSCPKTSSLIPTATQTEIVAVNTPQDETKVLFHNKLQLISHDSTTYAPGNEEKFAVESQNESENGSTTCTVKTVTEVYNDSNVDDTSVEEGPPTPISSQERVTTQIGEKLTKPTVKLNEEPDKQVSNSDDLENSQKNSESDNGCNS